MWVVDTSALVEWLSRSPTGLDVMPLLPSRDEWLVPTIVQMELQKWLAREFDERRAYRVMAFLQKCFVIPLDTSIALLAADLCASAKLATADAVIYSTALRHGALLLTCDAHFSGLAGVVHVPKVRS